VANRRKGGKRNASKTTEKKQEGGKRETTKTETRNEKWDCCKEKRNEVERMKKTRAKVIRVYQQQK